MSSYPWRFGILETKLPPHFKWIGFTQLFENSSSNSPRAQTDLFMFHLPKVLVIFSWRRTFPVYKNPFLTKFYLEVLEILCLEVWHSKNQCRSEVTYLVFDNILMAITILLVVWQKEIWYFWKVRDLFFNIRYISETYL